jgi:hypothetical protein
VGILPLQLWRYFTFPVRFMFRLLCCLYILCAFYILVMGLSLLFACVLYFHCGTIFTLCTIYFPFIYFMRAIYIPWAIYISWYYVRLSRCDAQIFHAQQFYAVMLSKYFKKLVLRRQSYCAGHGAGMGLPEFSNGNGSCSEQGAWWWIHRRDRTLVSQEMWFPEGQRALLF